MALGDHNQHGLTDPEPQNGQRFEPGDKSGRARGRVPGAVSRSGGLSENTEAHSVDVASVNAPGCAPVDRSHVDSVLLTMVACHECDLLHEKKELEQGQVARCFRCNAFLYANKPNSIDRALAVSLAALIMFVVANAFPFLAISVSGNTQSISIISAVFALSGKGLWMLGLLSFGFILLIPLLRVIGLLYILLPLRFERRLPGIEIVFRGIVAMSPWSMMEIYMFGAIVALVKLASMANIELGLSFWAFALLNLLSVLAAQMVDKHSLWEIISHSRGGRHLFVSAEDNPEDSVTVEQRR